MSRFDGRRLGSGVFKLDVERMRRGWYSDRYFVNIQKVLETFRDRGLRYEGHDPFGVPPDVDLSQVLLGDIEVEMQWFTRRKPWALVCGVDKALAMLRECTGSFDKHGQWQSTANHLRVWAVKDGDLAPYGGDPAKVCPVIRVQGRYRDFAALETPTLGALSRGSRVATNVYRILEAAAGKTVLFFPARFDAHEIQAMDGYAYHIAVQRYAEDCPPEATSSHVSTDAQGDWWDGEGGGTVAHAAIATFFGDVAATMIAFAESLPANLPRIALVDFRNDCVGDTLRVMDALWPRWLAAKMAGEDPERYRLSGVRPDTSGSLRDVSVPDSGDPRQDNGVNPRLVRAMRAAIDAAWLRWDVPDGWQDMAQNWCRSVQIVATGGFSPEKIRRFEAEGVPVDTYGVGSWCFRNDDQTNTDFTADIVRVKINGEWLEMHKIGRAPGVNPDLEPITL